MRTVLSTLILVFLLASQSFAEEGVNKVKKSKLKIDKIGTVTSEINEIITANIKASKSKNKGKWQGIGGKIFGKFYPKGSDEIINVSENKIHKINRKKKKCETRPLVTEETKEAQKSFKSIMKQMRTGQDKRKDLDEEERESNIEILAQKFVVDKLKGEVTRNGFMCNQFLITFYTKSRNKQTGLVRLDSASVKTDMTKMTAEIRKALEIERAFGKNYFEKLGLQFDFMKQDLLGGGYLEKIKQANKNLDVSFADQPNIAEQISKLDNFYPIVTHGEMYSIVLNAGQDTQGEKDTGDSDKTGVTDIKKKGFGFAKGLFGKKKKDKPTGPVPFLVFDDELIKLTVGDFTDALHPPYKCKVKN